MLKPLESFAAHLKGFSAVNLNAENTADALEERLRKYGTVGRSSFSKLSDALNYVVPVKSFTTRFLVLGLSEWSIILCDMRGENCYVDAYAISRVRHCRGIGLFLRDERRELHLFEEGKKVRQVQSLRDGDAWYYREEGALQKFEDPNEYLRIKKQDRLSVDATRRYFEAYTTLAVPDWKNLKFANMLGLERNTKDLRVPITEFETIMDI